MPKHVHSGTFDRAVVALANHHQFPADGATRQPCVQSRMLLWCITGRGMIRVNRQRCTLEPREFAFLPWERDLTYMPDPANPFRVGGIHVIPVHERSQPVEFTVPHNSDHPLFDCSYRHDITEARLSPHLSGSFASYPGLRHLAEYIVAWFQRGEHDETVARRLGQTLLEELVHVSRTPSPERANYPVRLKRMMEYIQQHLHENLTVDQLAEIGQCSASTVHRLFRQTLKVSPMDWIIDSRIQRAAHLLSTTSLGVGDIGRQVGIEDRYYFSKRFRSRMGMPAREFRKRHTLT